MVVMNSFAEQKKSILCLAVEPTKMTHEISWFYEKD